MLTMSLNPVLDWAVVVLPTLLSLLGVLVTLEPWDKKHKTKWRVGLIAFGFIVSTLTYWQQARQRTNADRTEREFREHAMEEERNSADKLRQLNDTFRAYLARTSREHEPQRPETLTLPTAEEIAAALGKELKDAQHSEHQIPSETPPSAKETVPPHVVSPPVQSQLIRQCRGDRLGECSDEELLHWGQPFVAKVETIEAKYMSDLKQLDDVRGGNWFGELIGVGGKDSKWLKAYTLAQQAAADSFRDCCGEGVLTYRRELARRTGAGQEKTKLYGWVEDLLKPHKSKEWKNAREDGGNIVNIVADLHILQINLRVAPSLRH